MKKSELKALIREVVEEANMENPCWKGYKAYGTKKKDGKTVLNCVPVKEEVGESDPLAQKFFLGAYNHIKKNGQKKTHYRQLAGLTQGDRVGETWTLGDTKAADLNQHYSRAVYSPSVSVYMDRKGKMNWAKGSLDDLKELLVSISEQKIKEGWKDAAKAVGIAGAIAGAGFGGKYLDDRAPRVEVGGQICYVVPEDHGKIPRNAFILKGKDGKMYKVWTERNGKNFAFPADK